jgi:hypothetical protein
MRDQSTSRQKAVAEFADREHGVAAHEELIRLGLSPSAVGRWAADGRLHRVHRGVYAIGRAELSREGRWLAAVKACGPGAALSHQSAAALWGLRRTSSAAIHVTTPRQSSRCGVTVHTVRRLDPSEWVVHDRIPVTSVARTASDCASVMPTRDVVRLLEQAERLGVFDLGALAARPGLKPALAQMEPDAPRVNSDWERDLLDWCADIGVPKPELNVIVEGFVVDALWRAKKVIVELDSWTFHRSRRAFEEDRRRVAILQLAGYLVLPLTALDAEAARLVSAGVAAR